MTFIDTHTHIYDEAFAGEEDEVIKRARQAGVTVMLQPDVDSRERDAMFALVDRHPDELHAMLGLYPGSVDKGWRDEIDAMLRYRGLKVVALGEIGLDYHYGAEFAAEQREAFRIQMELAAEMDLPVNIHLREATEDFFRIMDDCAHLHVRGSLHAFSGSYETDSPYLTPVPHRGERNESKYIPLIAAKIAELKGTCVDEVAQVTTGNARRLFNI